MKKIKIIILISSLFFLGFFLLYNLFFDQNDLKYADLHAIEKSYLGGIVINKTNHHIKITDNTKILDLPPHKTSRDIGLFDADSVIIETPTLFKGKKYTYGVVKFCDFASLKIIDNKKIDKIKTSLLYKLCPLVDRSGWYPSIKDAFPPIYKDNR